MDNVKSITLDKTTLELKGVQSFLFQLLFISLAVGMPVACHLGGLPVRYLLPMHWAVILAGLVYGWKSGVLTGLLSPSVSFLISGMPLPNILPSMTIELVAYGFLTGILREKFKMNSFLSVAIALVSGRIIFIAFAFLTNAVAGNYTEYLKSAMLPGLIAVVCQILLLPFIAKWWVNKDRSH